MEKVNRYEFQKSHVPVVVVAGAVDAFVGGFVGGAVGGAVGGSVGDAVDGAVEGGVVRHILKSLECESKYILKTPDRFS